ncbi:hypothetical protein HDU81_008323 [Chytriomyces hyalinus]|nr:hypothetical protein HDU81_008323 [Chytriomyces hyalinus]
MTSIDFLLSPVRARLEEQNQKIQDLEQQLARAQSDLAAATQRSESLALSHSKNGSESALAASLPADDIGDLAESHVWTGTECPGGVFYNELIRRIIPDYDDIDTESRKAVKAAVFAYLSHHLPYDPKHASHLKNSWQETYIVPDHMRATFLEWLYPELKRCFPDDALPFSNDLFRDLDPPKSANSDRTAQAKPLHEEVPKNIPTATLPISSKSPALETRDYSSDLDIATDSSARYSCPYPNCNSKPKTEAALKTHINDAHRDLDLVLPSGFSTLLVRNKDGKLTCICNKFECKSATSLQMHIKGRKCFQSLEDDHARQQQQQPSLATSSLKRVGSEDTASQKKAPGSSSKKRK